MAFSSPSSAILFSSALLSNLPVLFPHRLSLFLIFSPCDPFRFTFYHSALVSLAPPVNHYGWIFWDVSVLHSSSWEFGWKNKSVRSYHASSQRCSDLLSARHMWEGFNPFTPLPLPIPESVHCDVSVSRCVSPHWILLYIYASGIQLGLIVALCSCISRPPFFFFFSLCSIAKAC